MIDNPGINENAPQFLVGPYLTLARNSLSPLVSDGTIPENGAFMNRMHTFAATCGLWAYSSADLQARASKQDAQTFIELIRLAMTQLNTTAFPDTKRIEVEKTLKSLSDKPNYSAAELYSIFFGLTGDTAMGAFEEAVITSLNKDPDKKIILAMMSF